LGEDSDLSADRPEDKRLLNSMTIDEFIDFEYLDIKPKI